MGRTCPSGTEAKKVSRTGVGPGIVTNSAIGKHRGCVSPALPRDYNTAFVPFPLLSLTHDVRL